jgi:long-chain acyl-CoA synthetase
MTDRDALISRGMAIAVHAEAVPDRVAIVSGNGNRTWSELNQHANQLVRALRRRGVRTGDAVALMSSNRPEFVEVYAATLRAGLRLTPINFHLTADEAGYIVRDCDATAFIGDARFADAVAGAPPADVAIRLAIGGTIEGFESYDDALATEDGTDIVDPEAGVVMYYTSGTTGRPKGVYRRERAEPSRTLKAAMATGYTTDSVHLCTGPLYHAAPLGMSVVVPLGAGATIVLMDKWDPEATLRLIEEHRVTHTHVVPTMFHRLLALPEDVRDRYRVSSLRSVMHGAAPCPIPEKTRMIEWFGPVITEYFAATEGGGTLVDSATWMQRPGTVGRCDPPGEVIVADNDAEPLPARQAGLVWFKAPAVGRFEYYKDPTKTDEAYRGDYFTLGDMGYVDDDGFLFLTDRTADLIISGGVNIYPAEVDAVLLEHPAVADAATIGVPNDEWGEEVKAVVELRDGVAPNDALAAELVGLCRDRLAHYKCPRSVDFVDQLPRQDNGKIYKRLVRDRYRMQPTPDFVTEVT